MLALTERYVRPLALYAQFAGWLEFALRCGLGLRLAEGGKFAGQSLMEQRKLGNRKEGRILGPGLADSKSGHRNPGRHLDNREQGVESLHGATLHRHAQHRHCRLGGDHSRKMGGASRTGNDGMESPRLGFLGIGSHGIRHPVGGDDPVFARNTELLQQRHGVTHGLPVALAPHDNADQGSGRRGVIPGFL